MANLNWATLQPRNIRRVTSCLSFAQSICTDVGRRLWTLELNCASLATFWGSCLISIHLQLIARLIANHGGTTASAHRFQPVWPKIRCWAVLITSIGNASSTYCKHLGASGEYVRPPASTTSIAGFGSFHYFGAAAVQQREPRPSFPTWRLQPLISSLRLLDPNSAPGLPFSGAI
jgi:hypothetical protein